jgi:hypothetical protein
MSNTNEVDCYKSKFDVVREKYPSSLIREGLKDTNLESSELYLQTQEQIENANTVHYSEIQYESSPILNDSESSHLFDFVSTKYNLIKGFFIRCDNAHNLKLYLSSIDQILLRIANQCIQQTSGKLLYLMCQTNKSNLFETFATHTHPYPCNHKYHEISIEIKYHNLPKLNENIELVIEYQNKMMHETYPDGLGWSKPIRERIYPFTSFETYKNNSNNKLLLRNHPCTGGILAAMLIFDEPNVLKNACIHFMKDDKKIFPTINFGSDILSKVMLDKVGLNCLSETKKVYFLNFTEFNPFHINTEGMKQSILYKNSQHTQKLQMILTWNNNKIYNGDVHLIQFNYNILRIFGGMVGKKYDA